MTSLPTHLWKKARHWIILHPLPVVGLVGTIVVLSVAGIGLAQRQGDRDATQTQLETLTIEAQQSDLQIQVAATGEVQPIQRVNLSPKTQGRLERLLVEQGDRVQQGQVVAQMESRELTAQLAQAEARLSRAQANLAQLRAGTRSEEIQQARAQVSQSQARLDQVQAKFAELQAGSRIEEIREAEAAALRADSGVADARSRLNLAALEYDRSVELERDGAIARRELDQRAEERQRASANLDQAIAAAEEARQRLERLRNGARWEEIRSAQAEVDAATAEVTVNRERLRQLEAGARSEEIDRAIADVQEAQAQVEFAQTQLDDAAVRAPFSGIIVQRYADPGAFVTPATSASTASSATSTSILALAKGLEILAKVPEADISQLQNGQTVKVVADAYPDATFEGRVKLIAPEAVREQNVTLFQVRLEILSGLDRLQSGMNVDLTFIGETRDDAIVVPSVAIITHRGQTGVLIPDAEDEAQFHPVTIGANVGSNVQILDGLAAGDRVFIGLPDGQELEDVLNNFGKKTERSSE